MANYSDLNPLGEGGMGVVYRAVQRRTERVVAVKFLHPGADLCRDSLCRFDTEVRALARARHPNVVEVFEVGEEGGRPFFSMEFVPGGTLARRLRAGPVGPREAARILAAVAAAVAAAHGVGVLHRDLKPSNILLGADGSPKVADFGLAKLGDGDDGLTASGALMGTPGYMAPEQAAGLALGFFPPTDVYGLGATLYELLCGRPPFRGETREETLRKVRTEPPEPPGRVLRDVPAELEAVCLKCLEKDPARRFPTVRDVADELNRWLAGVPTRTRPLTRWGRVRRWARVNRVKLAAAALLPLAALAAAVSDPRRRAEWRLAAGLPVTLVGETGLPASYEWRMGEVLLAPSAAGDGSCGFQTFTTSVLVLAHDPRCDTYRVTAELRHIRSHADDGVVGLFFGMRDVPARADLRVTRFLGFEYNDFWRLAEEQMPHLKPIHGLDVRDVLVVADGRGDRLSWINCRGAPFTPTSVTPNDWRKLVADVSPAGVSVTFQNPDGSAATRVLLTADRIEQNIGQHNRVEASEYPGFAIPPQKWDPRGPLGVYARDSAAAVRNVTLEPRPAPNGTDGASP